MSRYFLHPYPLIDFLKLISLNLVFSMQMTLITSFTRMGQLSLDLKIHSITEVQTMISMITLFNLLIKGSDSEEIWSVQARRGVKLTSRGCSLRISPTSHSMVEMQLWLLKEKEECLISRGLRI